MGSRRKLKPAPSVGENSFFMVYSYSCRFFRFRFMCTHADESVMAAPWPYIVWKVLVRSTAIFTGLPGFSALKGMEPCRSNVKLSSWWTPFWTCLTSPSSTLVRTTVTSPARTGVVHRANAPAVTAQAA